jgi:hypothetical protein
MLLDGLLLLLLLLRCRACSSCEQCASCKEHKERAYSLWPYRRLPPKIAANLLYRRVLCYIRIRAQIQPNHSAPRSRKAAAAAAAAATTAGFA